MRSYDLLIRMGGDEFLCVLPKIGPDEARARFGDLSEELNGSAGTSVSIGFGELLDDDTPELLVGRADDDLLASRAGYSRSTRTSSRGAHALEVRCLPAPIAQLDRATPS